MSSNQEIGRIGEEIARKILVDKGYEILEQGWRYNKAEVDIICKLDDALIFVEVKTRSSDFFGSPEEFVTKKKQQLMSMAASAYMRKTNHTWEIRFDVISVIFSSSAEYRTQHFEDAFFPGL